MLCKLCGIPMKKVQSFEKDKALVFYRCEKCKWESRRKKNLYLCEEKQNDNKNRKINNQNKNRNNKANKYRKENNVG